MLTYCLVESILDLSFIVHFYLDNLDIDQKSVFISLIRINYRIVASTSTCYYSENQVFGGVTIRVLCSKRGCY